MDQFDPRVADRLRRLALVAEDVATRPDPGPYEVGVLRELIEAAAELAGHEARRPRYDYHMGRGRAVDLPPRTGPWEWINKQRASTRTPEQE